ncbi:MAG: phosphatase PAP2 family protein, partial [Acidimicrobiales bacterium]
MGRRGALVRVSMVVAIALAASACTTTHPTRAFRMPGAEPSAAQWKTWVLTSPADVTVPPPPAPGSAEAIADTRELEDAVALRTPSALDAMAAWDGAGEPISGPWMRMAFELVSARAPDPPAASRAYALLAVAAYDAMVATWYWKYRYQRAAPDVVEKASPSGADPSYPSEHAAIAGAAAKVLAYLFPERPARVVSDAAIEAATSRVLAGANWPSDTTAGLVLGDEVGAKVVAYAEADGAARPCTKEAPGGRPQFWAPPTGVAGAPVQPCAGEWRPWVLESGSQFRPEPPPVFGDGAFEDQAYQAIGVKRDLTPEQKRTATYWAGGAGTAQAAGIWNDIAIGYIRTRLPTEPQSERVLALA